MGTSGNVIASLPARDGPSSALFENSRNLASSSCGLGPGTAGNVVERGRGMRREPHSSSLPTPCFNQGVATLNPSKSYWRNLSLQWYGMEFPFISLAARFRTATRSNTLTDGLAKFQAAPVTVSPSMPFPTAGEKTMHHVSMAYSTVEAHNHVCQLDRSGAVIGSPPHKMQKAARTLPCEVTAA